MSECIDNCSLIVFKDAEIGKLEAENTALNIQLKNRDLQYNELVETADELRYNWMEETRQLNQQLETTKEQLTKYEGYKKLDEFLSKNVNTDKESFIQKCFELEEQLVEALPFLEEIRAVKIVNKIKLEGVISGDRTINKAINLLKEHINTIEKLLQTIKGR